MEAGWFLKFIENFLVKSVYFYAVACADFSFEINVSNLFLFFFSKCGNILYKAQSQDEDALVNAAAYLHMVFVNKNANILGESHLSEGKVVQIHELLD